MHQMLAQHIQERRARIHEAARSARRSHSPMSAPGAKGAHRLGQQVIGLQERPHGILARNLVRVAIASGTGPILWQCAAMQKRGLSEVYRLIEMTYVIYLVI